MDTTNTMGDFWFRAVHDELLRDETDSWQVLSKWHDESLKEVQYLKKYGSPDAINWKLSTEPSAPNEVPYFENWQLYALSRISDILLLPFQSGDYDGSTWSPSVSLEQRTEYWTSLGMTQFSIPHFHPFYHEIVEVEQSDDPSEPITLIHEIWPGFMMDHMMFCRAGVKVRGGTNYLIKDIAEYSTILFTYWRRNRPCFDLSHWSGSNSQWSTKFRRDYFVDDTYYYNVDGVFDALKTYPLDHPDDPELRQQISADERVELLTNRCFLRFTTHPDELWPYDDFYIEKVG